MLRLTTVERSCPNGASGIASSRRVLHRPDLALDPPSRATVLLIVSLAIRPTRGIVADRSGFSPPAGLALAYLTGGALFAGGPRRVRALHALDRVGDRADGQSPGIAARPAVDCPARRGSSVAVAVQVATVAAIARTDLIIVPLRGIGVIVPFGLLCLAWHLVPPGRGVPPPRCRQSQPMPARGVSIVPAHDRRWSRPAEGVAPHLAKGGRASADYSYGVRRPLRLESLCHGRDCRPAGRRSLRAEAGPVERVHGVAGADQLYRADVITRSPAMPTWRSWRGILVCACKICLRGTDGGEILADWHLGLRIVCAQRPWSA